MFMFPLLDTAVRNQPQPILNDNDLHLVLFSLEYQPIQQQIDPGKTTMKTALLSASVLACLLSLSASAADKAPPTIEDLWEIIQKQQAEIDALKNQQQDTAKQAADADEKAEAAVVAIEESGSATSAKSSWTDRTTIGGYGELHYNNINNDGIDDKNEIDFHRFVLFFGHEFTDKLRFFSEFELEHALAGDGKNGEIELEQAYIEYDIRDNLQTRGGLFLMPVGILGWWAEWLLFQWYQLGSGADLGAGHSHNG
jgi:phosphate-selective porin